jgi:hypothetical protein
MNRKQDPLEKFLSRHVDPLKNASQRLAETDKERLLKSILSAGADQQTAPAIPHRERSTRFLVAAAAVLVAIALFSLNLQRPSKSEVSLKSPNDKRRVIAAGLVLPATQDAGLLRGTVLDHGSAGPISDVHIFIGRGAADPAVLDGLTKVISLMSDASANFPLLEETLQDVLNDEKDEEMRNGNFKLLTGTDGRFTIQNMPAGPYTVVAYRQGYVGAGKLSASPEWGGASFSLIALATVHITSQQTSEVTLKLARGGALSGRVIGRDGKPRPNIEVAVSEITYDERTGAPLLLPAKTAKSDDRGEFRIFHIPPGEYYLAASPPRVRDESGMGVPREFVETYYPNAISTEDTRPIAIRAGDDLAGFDIHLQTVPRFTVSGRVISLLPADEPLPQGAEGAAEIRNFAGLKIFARGENPYWGPEMRVSPFLAYVDVTKPVNGAFEIAGIPPGSYDVYAMMADALNAKNLKNTAWGRTAFEVRNRNVSDITVTVHRSVDVGGQVFVDGSTSTAPVRLRLQPADSAADILALVYAPEIQIERDGSFAIPGLPAFTFRPHATIKGDGLPASAYVADIRQGGRSVYDDGFTAGPVTASPLEVVINTKGGTVEGVVDRAKAFVALVPPPSRRQNGDLYKTMVTNSQRQFRFEGVPPGSYKLFAWENIPANAHRNGDFLKAYESRGASITVQQGATVFQRLEVLVAP